MINKFKNKRRGDQSKEVVDKKRQKTGLLNYLPADHEAADCGELRHKLRHGELHGAEVRIETSTTHLTFVLYVSCVYNNVRTS